MQDRGRCPTIEEMGAYVGNPVFLQFCTEMKLKYSCAEKIEFSACSWERGWNVKFKKSGKTLCTLYPKEGYFKAMVVIGQKEKGPAEAILPGCSPELQGIYAQTQEGNGQKWLMIDLEDQGDLYRDVFRLVEVRKGL